ncbi:MAG: tetratricopeptide repeat protein [Caldilineaceae bacterium]
MSSDTRSTRLNRVSLADWNQAIDDLIQNRQAEDAIGRIRTVLKNLPRHLPSYFRLLQAIWLLRRWDEGEDWALRLLRADPCNELAWAVLANAAEQRGSLSEARGFWSRAFENAPYNRYIRAGMVRTSPGKADPLHLTPVALASLCRMDGRWDRAVAFYTSLQTEYPRRTDIQCARAESFWRAGQLEEALRLSSHLVHREPNLLIGWVVSMQIGDETDRALALAPLAALDADGEYMAVRFGVELAPEQPATIGISSQEAAWLRG